MHPDLYTRMLYTVVTSRVHISTSICLFLRISWPHFLNTTSSNILIKSFTIVAWLRGLEPLPSVMTRPLAVDFRLWAPSGCTVIFWKPVITTTAIYSTPVTVSYCPAERTRETPRMLMHNGSSPVTARPRTSARYTKWILMQLKITNALLHASLIIQKPGDHQASTRTTRKIRVHVTSFLDSLTASWTFLVTTCFFSFDESWFPHLFFFSSPICRSEEWRFVFH